MDHLIEDKNKLIQNNQNMSDEEKQIVGDFFKAHSNYESKIDWNNKTLSFQDFETIMNQAAESKSNKKRETKKNIALLFQDKTNYAIITDTPKYIFVAPLTHEACVFMDSFECGGEGAQWCIGTKDNDAYWKSYAITKRGQFVFVMRKNAPNKHQMKYMIQFRGADSKQYKVWDQNDYPVKELRFDIGFDELHELVIPIFEERVYKD